MQAGQFIIEYCGEVISWKEAKQRSHTYEIQGDLIGLPNICLYYFIETEFNLCIDVGLRDAFIISLNASESIDATEKGSVARFINHSW